MTKPNKPASRPQMKQADIMKLLPTEYLEKLKGYEVFFIGIRGYYKDTMGAPGVNDRGIYDDAIFLIGPNYFKSFNANTDPSKHQKTIAVLMPGVYLYKPGLHGISGKHPYKAFRQHSNVTVKRDGVDKLDTDAAHDRFWINIHKGGYSTTSSLGCQTIHPDQWLEAQVEGYELLERNNQAVIPYALIEV